MEAEQNLERLNQSLKLSKDVYCLGNSPYGFHEGKYSDMEEAWNDLCRRFLSETEKDSYVQFYKCEDIDGRIHKTLLKKDYVTIN